MTGRQNKETRGGFSVLQILTVTVLIALIATGTYYYIRQQMLARECAANLRRIYAALELYEIDRGTLPRLAFFPDDPKQDPDSIVVALTPYGTTPDVYLCPTAPLPHRELGLTYLWNTRLNGRKIPRASTPEWMLVEINALSDEVPASHMGKYNVLYTDGAVHREKDPPAGLREL